MPLHYRIGRIKVFVDHGHHKPHFIVLSLNPYDSAMAAGFKLKLFQAVGGDSLIFNPVRNEGILV